MSWLASLPPGVLLILGALFLPLVRGRARQGAAVALPVLSYLHLLALPAGESAPIQLFGLELVLVRIDPLAMVWGHVFHLAAILSAVYAWHVRSGGQLAAALSYAGSAIAAVFAASEADEGADEADRPPCGPCRDRHRLGLRRQPPA